MSGSHVAWDETARPHPSAQLHFFEDGENCMENDTENESESSKVEVDNASSNMDPSKAEPSRLEKWWSKMRWRAQCLFPRWISHPFSGDEAYLRSRDEKHYQETRVPLDQELRSAAIWGVEIYGPDEIHDLYAGLDRLGWKGVGSAKPDNAASIRVRQMRGAGSGGWMNIGHIHRRGEADRYSMVHNFATLPPGVDSLLVGVFNITPSTTAVLIAFRLNDNFGRRYEIELNTDRTTITRRRKGTWSMEWWEPVHQKEEAIAKARAELRSMVGTWFSRNLPGYFCAAEATRSFPTMELIVGEGMKWRDADDLSLRDWGTWRRLVAQDISHEVWDTEEYASLQLAFERHRDDHNGLHVLVCLDPKKLPEEATRHVGGADLSAYTWLCNNVLGGTLVHSATVEYLMSQRRSLQHLRERMKRARTGRRHVARTLTEIGGFFDRTLGSPAVLGELYAHSKHVGWYRHDCAKLTAPAWRDGEAPQELAEMIRGQVRHLAKQLSVEEVALREHIEQLASILSVRESIRSQRWTLALTVLALAVAAASLIIAIPAESELGKTLRALWHATESVFHHVLPW